MGCDGGTIPRRDELVRQKKKPEQKDKNAENVAKWKHCALSQQPLHKPIVSCELGKLYNKEAVIEHLLNKEKIASSEVASHVTKLSDVKELNLTEKNGFKAKSDQKGDEYVDFHDSRFICPVTGLDMNGIQKFFFLWKCGCVISERAFKEVKSETCHKCGKAYEGDDAIVINGTDEEIDALKDKMIERRRLAKLEKKKKRAAAAAGESEVKKIKVEPSDAVAGTSTGGVTEPAKKIKIEPTANGIPLTNGKTSKLNGKADALSHNGKASSKALDLPHKAQKEYSIAKDPSASAAYKSLFTSHKSAKTQGKAHWITHNPLYF
ncbi:replication termination factor 2-like [Uloborus diversus]|uniref:replication termination factor 2-like n=1 Tax=Uloborus diversus TaxID=327109 RepID=UPI002409FAE8|nr:replication termination factor 2-like [Uloborus diversus]